IQKENIENTLKHAIAESSFYKDFCDGAPTEKKSKEEFSSVTLVDKEKIMDNLDNVFTSSLLRRESLEQHLATSPVGKRYMDEFTVIHTSGSSGNIGIFAYDPVSWDTLKALVLARCTSFGIGLKRKRLAFIGLTDGHYAGVTLASDVPRIMANYTDVSVNEPISKTVEHLKEFQPDDLRGYPSGLVLLASEQQAGRLDIKPNKVVSSAEPLDEKTTRLIEEVFGVTPYNFYAASESIGIAQDCDLHCGLHVFNDLHVVEILNDKGEALPPGKPGEVVLTNLYNRCQPLIRYRLRDIAVYSEEECDCGLPYPLLKNIYGRQEETIWVENGQGGFDVIHPMVFTEFFVPGLRRLQVHYEKRNKLRLLVMGKGNSDDILKAVEDRMNNILSGKNLQDIVDFHVEIVDSIVPDKKTGKTKTVVSYVEPPRTI
ncbi:MAG: phenylacetate--CoA ligase family protein, partial [Candidatus Thorarchaeota archaeon]